MATDPRTYIATLRESHDKLDGLVRPLTSDQVRDQSYCTDWSVAQVLSHLGISFPFKLSFHLYFHVHHVLQLHMVL